MARIIARLNVGGPAQHVVWLSEGMRETYDTTLVVGEVPQGEADMGDFAREHGVSPVVVKGLSREIGPRDAMALWRLLRVLWRVKPDVVHTHTAKAGTLGRMAAWVSRRVTGRPRLVVHTFHGHVFHGYWGPRKTRLFLAIERWLARHATDRIVVLSEEQFHEIHETFGVGHREQFAVIPLGLDLERFTAPPGPALVPALDEAAFAVGTAGRFTAVKNYPLLLEAFAALPPDGRLFMAGDGADRGPLEEHGRSVGVADRVHWLGMVRELDRLYPHLDVFVLSSNNEGTPLSMLEAMAAGTPVVSTLVGGVPDLLGRELRREGPVSVRERGLGVTAGDGQGLAAALWMVRGDPQGAKDRRAAARAWVLEHHGLSRLVADVDRLYRQGPGLA